jgi:hypothetical protein
LVLCRKQFGDKDKNTAANLRQLATALLRLKKYGEVRSLLGEAQAIYEHLGNSDPADLGETLARLNEYYCATDRHADAAEVASRRSRLWPRDPAQAMEAAREMAVCIPAVGRGRQELTPEEQSERERYAQQAVSLLKRAIRYGYRDRESINQNHDFDPLRGRDDFGKLISELQMNKPVAK